MVSIIIALILTAVQLIAFSRSRIAFPAGMVIGGVPVGNLTRQQAAERLLEVYSLPIELVYNGQAIHMDPAVVGFQLNVESMLAAANLETTGGAFWRDFWNWLWGQRIAPQPVPLSFDYSETLLRDYLTNEIAARYDQFPTPARPAVGTVEFQPGTPGTTIDLDAAIFQIENALSSPARRTVELSLQLAAPPRPSLQNLEIFLKQTIDITGYDGLAGVYLLDLASGQELHFLYQQGVELTPDPDVAFTAASIVKIPIMVSAYRRLDGDSNQEATRLITEMIEKSGNDPADWLMEQIIDPFRGPLAVTEDMRAIGLDNTFLAGHFRLGSPLLAQISTPANTRPDVDTDPDLYNQTTLTDIGMLLTDIYQCANFNGGALVAVFPNQITQAECQEMITFLTLNRIGVLIEAGAPEGTQIAHKHGWVTDGSGIINTIGDAGIVFSPSGDYVVVIFLHHPVQLVWEPASTLIGDLATVIYNYYNLPSE